MKTEKLFELLTLVNGVTSTKWETVIQLVDQISKGSVIVEEKKWADSWKQKEPKCYPLDLSKRETWSTYNNGECVYLKFSNAATKNKGRKKNKLVCDVRIFDGHFFDGRRTDLRFEALLLLPDKFIHTIAERIEVYFDDYLNCAYEDHLESEKRIWIQNLRTEIIKQGVKPTKK